MSALVFTREDLLADHPYDHRQEEAGYKLHGGFTADGAYHSPKTLNRWPAVKAWQAQLTGRGWPLIDASQKLLKRGNYPNLEQQILLQKNGLGQSFWNALTVTGVIEARGRALCEFSPPDWQDIIVDDVSETCTGHLHKGLLYAHGADEGGDPDIPERGAHDAMWFAARDLVYGKDAFPMCDIPESIARPDEGPAFPQIEAAYGELLSLLANVLMIEVRAECFFAFSCAVFRHPETFPGNDAECEQAAQMIERIRTDEAIHVGYLVTAISEMRSFTFKTVDGGTIKGAEMIDPFWDKIVDWHSTTQFDEAAKRTRNTLVPQILEKGGEKLLAEFDALADARTMAAE